VLTRDSRNATGQFFIDEDALREAGVTDFEQSGGAWDGQPRHFCRTPLLFRSRIWFLLIILSSRLEGLPRVPTK
jgi:hypothetical protein